MNMKTVRQPYSENFSTKDFFLAGALLAAGRRLLRLEWKGTQAYFQFSDAKACEGLTQAFWNGDLSVSAKAFANQVEFQFLHRGVVHAGPPGNGPSRSAFVYFIFRIHRTRRQFSTNHTQGTTGNIRLFTSGAGAHKPHLCAYNTRYGRARVNEN